MTTQIVATDASGNLPLPSTFQNAVFLLEMRSETELLLKKVNLTEAVRAVLLAQSTPAHNQPAEPPAQNPATKTVSLTTNCPKRESPVEVIKTPGGRIRIAGYPITSFLKALGYRGWTPVTASQLLVKLSDLTGVRELREIAKKSTVGCQVGDGRRMAGGANPTYSVEPAELTDEQLDALSQLWAEDE